MIHADKMTINMQKTIQESQHLATSLNHQEISDLHLLHALLNIPETAIDPIIKKIGASPPTLLKNITTELEKKAKVTGTSQLYISNDANTLLDQSEKEADKLGDDYISCEHLLLAMAKGKT